MDVLLCALWNMKSARMRLLMHYEWRICLPVRSLYNTSRVMSAENERSLL